MENLKYKDSYEYFDEYAKSTPDDPLAWSGKALALLKLNKLDESLECANKALE